MSSFASSRASRIVALCGFTALVACAQHTPAVAITTVPAPVVTAVARAATSPSDEVVEIVKDSGTTGRWFLVAARSRRLIGVTDGSPMANGLLRVVLVKGDSTKH